MVEFTCSKCEICFINNHKPLIGDGNLNANIMFVSRNPTNFDFKANIPLVSKDGMLFQDFLNIFNLSRDLIYVTNAVKCKTPGHRHPTDIEIYNCQDYLSSEINYIDPKIIVLMGNTALRSYFRLAYSSLSIDIEELNGKYMIHQNRIILFMIHPSNAIAITENRRKIFNAFTTLISLYRLINPAHQINFY